MRTTATVYAYLCDRLCVEESELFTELSTACAVLWDRFDMQNAKADSTLLSPKVLPGERKNTGGVLIKV